MSPPPPTNYKPKTVKTSLQNANVLGSLPPIEEDLINLEMKRKAWKTIPNEISRLVPPTPTWQERMRLGAENLPKTNSFIAGLTNKADQILSGGAGLMGFLGVPDDSTNLFEGNSTTEVEEPEDMFPESFKSLIRTRENLPGPKKEYKPMKKAYLDTENRLTVGTGHLITDKDRKRFKKEFNKEIRIDTQFPESWLKRFEEEDLEKSYKAAKTQAKELGVTDQNFIDVLGSVNHQLGVNWNKEHKNTWKYLKAGEWEKAAEEVADSKWNSQTRSRVEDFQGEIRGLIT